MFFVEILTHSCISTQNIARLTQWSNLLLKNINIDWVFVVGGRIKPGRGTNDNLQKKFNQLSTIPLRVPGENNNDENLYAHQYVLYNETVWPPSQNNKIKKTQSRSVHVYLQPHSNHSSLPSNVLYLQGIHNTCSKHKIIQYLRKHIWHSWQGYRQL